MTDTVVIQDGSGQKICPIGKQERCYAIDFGTASFQYLKNGLQSILLT